MLDNLKQLAEKWKRLDSKTKIIYAIIAIVLIITLVLSLTAGGDGKSVSATDLSNTDYYSEISGAADTDGSGYDAAMSSTDADSGGVVYGENYSSRDEVAAYISTYGELPFNYITKNEAKALGWKDEYDTVAQAAPGMSIGGDKFGNYEGLLPEKDGRQYYECDIDYTSGNRNAKRIIYSNDGLVFYTDDHYESFVQYNPETGTWK